MSNYFYDSNNDVYNMFLFCFGVLIGMFVFIGVNILEDSDTIVKNTEFKYNIGDNSALSMVNNGLLSFSFYESEYIVGLNYIDRDKLKKSIAMYVEEDQMYFEYVDIDCVNYLNIDCRKLYTYNLTNVSVY